MRSRLVRTVLAAVAALIVLLVPACDADGLVLRLTGPAVSPELSAAIALAAELI